VKQTVLVSDISGDTITDGDGATVSIKFDDARKGTTVLDVKASEVTDLVEKGRKQGRGRRPRSRRRWWRGHARSRPRVG
jgi:hypothetical protein